MRYCVSDGRDLSKTLVHLVIGLRKEQAGAMMAFLTVALHDACVGKNSKQQEIRIKSLQSGRNPTVSIFGCTNLDAPLYKVTAVTSYSHLAICLSLSSLHLQPPPALSSAQ
jgi:hypothetical protein